VGQLEIEGFHAGGAKQRRKTAKRYMPLIPGALWFSLRASSVILFLKLSHYHKLMLLDRFVMRSVDFFELKLIVREISPNERDGSNLT
jgi:hypothetical protein